MRHAIYFTPDSESELHRLGSTWLGRDAHFMESLRQPDARLFAITASARRYGLHGTLKPPFRLKAGTSAASLEMTVQILSTQFEHFLTSPLELGFLDGFLALRPLSGCPELDRLAAGCVERLDEFRAAPGEDELRRRRAHGLTAVQEGLLSRWGYPYVFEEFRFHVTLTDKLTDDERDWVYQLAKKHFASVLGKALEFDAITIMVEPDDGEDFHIHQRFPLTQNALLAAS
jgi:putative phosphonate metabolism protein